MSPLTHHHYHHQAKANHGGPIKLPLLRRLLQKYLYKSSSSRSTGITSAQSPSLLCQLKMSHNSLNKRIKSSAGTQYPVLLRPLKHSHSSSVGHPSPRGHYIVHPHSFKPASSYHIYKIKIAARSLSLIGC